MSSRGARNLLLLSRSAAKSEKAQQFVNNMSAAGVNIQAPRCDISDYKTLATTLKDCARNLPPIMGCMQATMVLKVRGITTVYHRVQVMLIGPGYRPGKHDFP